MRSSTFKSCDCLGTVEKVNCDTCLRVVKVGHTLPVLSSSPLRFGVLWDPDILLGTKEGPQLWVRMGRDGVGICGN